MSKISHYSLYGALFIIVAFILITIRFSVRPDHAETSETSTLVFTKLQSLAKEGWVNQKLPMGNTESDKAAVERILRYDQAIFIRLSSVKMEFSVFVAYWRPGKVDIRGVNAHTPDTCWVQSGWSTRMQRSGFTGPPRKTGLLSGEYRCYENSGAVQYVAFWHMLGGQAIPMWRNGFPTLEFMWKTFTGEVKTLSAEQFFIRISSPRPLEELWDEPIFQQMLNALAPTGISTMP